jgi:hypothetical protein
LLSRGQRNWPRSRGCELFVAAGAFGEVTVGRVVSTVNVDVKSAAMELPVASVTPVAPLFTVTVYRTPFVRAAVGVSVATLVAAA